MLQVDIHHPCNPSHNHHPNSLLKGYHKLQPDEPLASFADLQKYPLDWPPNTEVWSIHFHLFEQVWSSYCK